MNGLVNNLEGELAMKTIHKYITFVQILSICIFVSLSGCAGNSSHYRELQNNECMINNFEHHEINHIYDRNLHEQDWGKIRKSFNGIDEKRVRIVSDKSSKVLEVSYPAGSCGATDKDGGCGKGGGAQWLYPLTFGEPYEVLTLSYRVKFSEDFDFVKGGKLPGLTGAPHALKMPPTGGLHPSDCDGFSARMMWRENGRIVLYLYHPDQKKNHAEDVELLNPLDGKAVHFKPGQWYTIKQTISMNTPGKRDGVIKIWVDDVLVHQNGSLRLRGANCKDIIGINQFYFSTFFGGNNPCWVTKKKEYIYFDDIEICRD